MRAAEGEGRTCRKRRFYRRPFFFGHRGQNHIAPSLSRQPLVKGERLVRIEVNAPGLTLRGHSSSEAVACSNLLQKAFPSQRRLEVSCPQNTGALRNPQEEGHVSRPSRSTGLVELRGELQEVRSPQAVSSGPSTIRRCSLQPPRRSDDSSDACMVSQQPRQLKPLAVGCRPNQTDG